MSAYDPRREAEKLALSLRSAVARTAATEMGALGLGTAVGTLATTVAIDVTGVLAAVLIARVGMFIIPKNRRLAREEFREQTKILRERLGEVTSRQFDEELNTAVKRMRAALQPYVEFVESELVRAREAESFLIKVLEDTAALKTDIQDVHETAPVPPAT